MKSSTLALLLVPALACAPTGSPAGPGGPAAADTATPGARGGQDSGAAGRPSLDLSSVSWTVQWDPSGLFPAEEGAWRIARADGATFELRAGWAVLHVVTLEPCTDERRRRGVPPPHGLPDHPSADTTTWALPLHEATPVALSTRQFDPGTFCEVGVALFQAHAETEGLPDAVDLVGTSLWLEGRVQPAPDAPWQEVVWTSALSAEADAALFGAGEPHADITVSLSPVTLLDGVRLDDPPELVGRGALTNLARSVSAQAAP